MHERVETSDGYPPHPLQCQRALLLTTELHVGLQHVLLGHQGSLVALSGLLAERFDEDPFLIFKLRGRTKEQITTALREKRVQTLPAEGVSPSESDGAGEADNSTLLEEKLDTFWHADEALLAFRVNPTRPEIDKAILKRLGNAPFALDGRNLAALLARAYDVVDDAIEQKTGV